MANCGSRDCQTPLAGHAYALFEDLDGTGGAQTDDADGPHLQSGIEGADAA
jgi:hypothetical protein